MKHRKKLSAIILSAVMLTTACSGSTSPDSSTQIKDSDPAASENAGTDDSADSTDNSNGIAPEGKSVKDVVGDIKVDTKVKILSWYDLNDTLTSECFTELFGIPEKMPKGYKSVSRGKSSSDNGDNAPFVDIRVSNYASKLTDLSRMIQSDDAPDAFPLLLGSYPVNVADGLFAPIDDIIDPELTEFKMYEQVWRKTRIGDHYCVPVYNVAPANVLWYRTSVINDNNLEDPWELYEKDEWTWSKFLEMSEKFTDKEKGKYAIDGYSTDFYLWQTTGLPLVELSDGKLKGNFKDEKIIKAMDFIRQFAPSQKGYRYPKETENNWSPSYPEWINGNTIFFNDGSWRYDETWQLYKNKKKWSDDEISFVPFPRCDDEKTYYQNVNIDSYLLPKGAKNIEGYKALIYSEAYAANNETIQSRLKENQKSEYDWTDRLLDRFSKINNPAAFSPVIEYKSSCEPDISSTGCYSNPVGEITDLCYIHGKDYLKSLDSEEYKNNVPLLNEIIGDINDRIELNLAN